MSQITELWGSKESTADEAVKVVKSGDTVAVSPQTTTPITLCNALLRRKDQLEGVRIHHPASRFPWAQPDSQLAFTLYDIYIGPENREQVNRGQAEYFATGPWYSGLPPAGMSTTPDVFLVSIGPQTTPGFAPFITVPGGASPWLRGQKQ